MKLHFYEKIGTLLYSWSYNLPLFLYQGFYTSLLREDSDIAGHLGHGDYEPPPMFITTSDNNHETEDDDEEEVNQRTIERS